MFFNILLFLNLFFFVFEIHMLETWNLHFFINNFNKLECLLFFLFKFQRFKKSSVKILSFTFRFSAEPRIIWMNNFKLNQTLCNWFLTPADNVRDNCHQLATSQTHMYDHMELLLFCSKRKLHMTRAIRQANTLTYYTIL